MNPILPACLLWLSAANPDTSPASVPAAERRFAVTRVETEGRAAWPADVRRVEYISGVDGGTDWATVSDPGHPADWIIFIHGHGSTGDQLYTRPDLRDSWLPRFRELRLGILTVTLRGNAWMSPAAAADLHNLLGWARARYAIKRTLFVSGSMGGTSNLIYAVVHPEDVDAVVALCPATDLTSYVAWCEERSTVPVLRAIADAITSNYGGSPKALRERYDAHSALLQSSRLKMPVYVAHGSADAIIPVSQARELATRLKGRSSFLYEEMEDGGHDAPLQKAKRGLDWVLERLNAGSSTQPAR